MNKITLISLDLAKSVFQVHGIDGVRHQGQAADAGGRWCFQRHMKTRDDALTKPSDVQQIFDNIPVEDKKLFWIEGTTRRWDGYNYFPEHPATRGRRLRFRESSVATGPTPHGEFGAFGLKLS